MKIFKRALVIIVTIILILILSFNIFNFISIKILGNELPTVNGYAYLEVISGSMEPKISIGDIVIIDTRVKKYKVKDIVTFKDINGSFVTHRIIEIKDDEIITQGDANNTVDDSITSDKIVGRYVYKLDGIGALMKSFRSPLTLVMILIIGVVLCVLVSTDSKGNAILTEEEKEYLEFLESKKKKKEIKEEKENKNIKKKTQSTRKNSNIKADTKKKSATKTAEAKPKKASSKKDTKSKTEVDKKTTTKTKTPKKESVTKTAEAKPKKTVSNNEPAKKKQTNKSTQKTEETLKKITSKKTKK